ncbi:unnamed protein product [Amoebophrya sp. A120]|nr:unnamed protein product [Amoebophrya sp. A120]|eukprot:GSA120T00005891001.1
MMFQEDNFYDEDDDFRTPMDDEDDTGSSTQVDERPSSRGPSATASPSTMTGALEGNNSTTTKVRQQHSSSYSDPTESSTSSDSPGSPDTLEHRRGMKRHSSSELDTIPIPNLELFSSSTRYRGVRPPEARPIPRIAGGSGLGGSSGGSYSGSSAGCSFTAKHYNHNRSSGGASTSSSSSIQGRNRWNSSYGTSRDTIEEVDGLENSVVPGSYNSTLTLATGSSSRDKNSVHKNYYVEGDPRLYHQNSLLTGEDPDFDEEMRQNFYFSVMKTFFRLAKNPSALIRSLQNLIIAAFPVLLTQDSSSSGSEEETVIENLAEQQINASNSSSSVGMNSLRRLFLYSSNNRAPSGSLYSATSAGGEQHQPGSSRTATINGKSMISLSRNYLYQKNKSSRSSNMLLLGTHLSTVEEGDVY